MELTFEQKQDLLTESKTFCMLPWTTIHSTPIGTAMPCCIANQAHPVGDANKSSIPELINSDAMCKLRLDMISGQENPICSTCYGHEKQGIGSYRQTNNEDYGKYVDEVIAATDEHGRLDDFKMRFFDFRVNNICNMKCRICNALYSSQWQKEDEKRNLFWNTISKDKRNEHVEEILKHIPYMEVAYFAGGEPLIAEEHYTILEEMIRLGRTDIVLKYNSNISTLKFKDKNVLDLWKHFNIRKPNGHEQKVMMFASLDDMGKRAEYIRSGTVWPEVDANFRQLKSLPYIHANINSVISIFNFVTFSEFYHYLLDSNLFTTRDYAYMIYPMTEAAYNTAKNLPVHLKEKGVAGLEGVIDRMKKMGFNDRQLQHLNNSIKWVMSEHTWEQHKNEFQADVRRLDALRDEKFVEVFPHLAELME